MRKTWFIALAGAALLALAPAIALAHGQARHGRHHHVRRNNRVRTHLRHFTAASSSTSPGTSPSGAGTTTPSDQAGTVTSFDGSKLVVTLTDGSIVSGVVNGQTELRCESAATSADGSGTMQSDSMRDGQPGSGDQANQGIQNDQGDRADQNDASGQNDQGDQNDASGQNDAGGQNDQADQNDQGGQNDAGQPATCTSANLTPGTVVREAELAVSSAGSVWRQVDLVLS